MAADAQSLNQLPWTESAVDAFAPILDVGPWAGLDSLQDVLHGSHLWEFRQGRVHALIALRGRQLAGGRVLEVVGLRSLGDRIAPAALDEAIEHVALTSYGEIDLLSLKTRWPHLVRNCQRQGWQVAGTNLTKRLRPH